jgi:hypothetical protein
MIHVRVILFLKKSLLKFPIFASFHEIALFISTLRASILPFPYEI